MIHIPTAEEFQQALNLNSNMPPETLAPVLQRDIARMIEIAHLASDAGFLGDDAVLSGGMAMRLRGSSRVSVKDTDLSTTPDTKITDDELLDVLEVQEDEVSIVPQRVNTSAAGDVREVFPVTFRFATPPMAMDARERQFRIDIAARGRALPPEPLEMRHEYPFEIGIEGIAIPTIALVESVAEKAFSYGAFRLAKHYADLAYAVDCFHEDLSNDAETLREVTRMKLDANLKQFARNMERQQIRDYASLRPPFEQDHYLRQVKRQWQADVGYVGQASEHYTFARANELVTTRLVPLLF